MRRGSGSSSYPGVVREELTDTSRAGKERPGEGDLIDGDQISRLAHPGAPFHYFGRPVPEPPSWELNEFGQPSWLLERPWAQVGCGWAVIVPPVEVDLPAVRWVDWLEADWRIASSGEHRDPPPWGPSTRVAAVSDVLAVGPASLPTIPRPASDPPPPRRSRPRIEWGQIEHAICAAWLSDVRGLPNREIAEALFPETARKSDEANARKRAREHALRGRWALWNLGVWPWRAVSLGDDEEEEFAPVDLPPRWWADPVVLGYLDVWRQIGRDRFGERSSGDFGVDLESAPRPTWA